MKKYKLAIVRPDGNVIPKGFYNSQELGLAQQLSLLNIDVDVYYAGNVDKVTITNMEAEGEGKVNLIELPFYIIPFIQQAQFPQLISELKKRSYDVIQVNEYNDLICSKTVNYAYKNNIPVIVYQGMYKNLSGRFNQMYTAFHDRFLLKNFIRKTSRAFTKTKAAANFLSEKGFENPQVMPVGLDLKAFEKYTQPHKDEQNFYKKYNIPANNKLVIYVGNFESRRNITFLLDIAESFNSQAVTFMFIGTGELFDQAERIVQNKHLLNVKLPGRLPQKELPDIYQAADLFLLASDYEIYGMVVLEAMFYGVPVISNNTAGPSSIIDSGKTGIILETLDKTAWVNKIETLLADEINLFKMKKTAKNKISQELTWEKIAHNYLHQVFHKLVPSPTKNSK